VVAVSILAVGSAEYALAAREAALSVLSHTDFEVHLACDEIARILMPNDRRIHQTLLARQPGLSRADPFLEKFAAWRACLAASADDIIMHLDADAVLVRPLSAGDVEAALGESGIAMVEQPTITGSTMARPDFLRHYAQNSLRFLAPGLPVPEPETFRYFNSGFALFRRAALTAFLDWAEDRRRHVPAHHDVAGNMMTDQDYIQVWLNSIAPGLCAELPGEWNASPLWSADLTLKEARVIHLSNFCQGPTPKTISLLQQFRTVPRPGAARYADQLTFVIVTCNSADYLDVAVEQAAALGRVVVVDNASDDRSVEIARSWGAVVIVNAVNEGFARAANRGAQAAETSVICFLNPDCFITPATVEAALSALSCSREQLIVPLFIDRRGERTDGRQPGYTRTKLAADLLETAGGGRLTQWLRKRRSAHDASWFWPIGACIFIDRSVFVRIGKFDETYFCYMEDVELGHTAAKAGIPTRQLDEAVIHLGQSGAKVDQAHRTALLDNARRHYGARAYGRWFVLLVDIVRSPLRVRSWAVARMKALARKVLS
jgi:GT2 family glycosyltransferase